MHLKGDCERQGTPALGPAMRAAFMDPQILPSELTEAHSVTLLNSIK